MSSYQIKLDPKSRVAGRFIHKVGRALQAAWTREQIDSGLTQAELARRLNVDRSVVHRHLDGAANMTLRTLAEYAWALGHEIEIAISKPEAAVNHPINPVFPTVSTTAGFTEKVASPGPQTITNVSSAVEHA